MAMSEAILSPSMRWHDQPLGTKATETLLLPKLLPEKEKKKTIPSTCITPGRSFYSHTSDGGIAIAPSEAPCFSIPALRKLFLMANQQLPCCDFIPLLLSSDTGIKNKLFPYSL